MRGELVSARAAIVTMAICLEGLGGVNNELAMNLRRAGLAPLERAMAELEARS